MVFEVSDMERGPYIIEELHFIYMLLAYLLMEV